MTEKMKYLKILSMKIWEKGHFLEPQTITGLRKWVTFGNHCITHKMGEVHLKRKRTLKGLEYI